MKKIIYIIVVLSALTGLWFIHIHAGLKIAISVVGLFAAYILYKIFTTDIKDDSMTDNYDYGQDIEKKKDKL